MIGPEAAALLRRSLWGRLNEFLIQEGNEEDECDISHDIHIAKCFEKIKRPTSNATNGKNTTTRVQMGNITTVRQRENIGGILRLLVSIDRSCHKTTKEMKDLIKSLTKMLMDGTHVGDLCGVECYLKPLSNVIVLRGQYWEVYTEETIGKGGVDIREDEDEEEGEEDDEEEEEEVQTGEKRRGRPKKSKNGGGPKKKRRGRKPMKKATATKKNDDTLTVTHRLALMVPLAEVVAEIYTRASMVERKEDDDEPFLFVDDCDRRKCAKIASVLIELVTVLRAMQDSEWEKNANETSRKDRIQNIKIMNRPRFRRTLQCSNISIPIIMMEKMIAVAGSPVSGAALSSSEDQQQQQQQQQPRYQWCPSLLTVTSSLELIPSHLLHHYSTKQLRNEMNNTNSLLHRMSYVLATLHHVTGQIVPEKPVVESSSEEEEAEETEETEEAEEAEKKKKKKRKKKRKKKGKPKEMLTSPYFVVDSIVRRLYKHGVDGAIGQSAKTVIRNINRTKIAIAPFVEVLQELTNIEEEDDGAGEDDGSVSKYARQNENVVYAMEDEYFQFRAAMLRLVRTAIDLFEPLVGPKQLRSLFSYWNLYASRRHAAAARQTTSTAMLYTNMSKILGEHLYNEITVGVSQNVVLLRLSLMQKCMDLASTIREEQTGDGKGSNILEPIALKLANLMREYDLSNLIVFKDLSNICLRVVVRSIELRDEKYEEEHHDGNSGNDNSSSSSSSSSTRQSSSFRIREKTTPTITTVSLGLIQAALRNDGYKIYTSIERRLDEEHKRKKTAESSNISSNTIPTAETVTPPSFVSAMAVTFRMIICSTYQIEQHSIFTALQNTTEALKQEFKQMTKIAAFKANDPRKTKPIPPPSTHRTIVDSVDILMLMVAKGIQSKHLCKNIYIMSNSSFEREKVVTNATKIYANILQELQAPGSEEWDLNMAKFIRTNVLDCFTRLLPIAGSVCRLRMTSKVPYATVVMESSKYQSKRNTYELWTTLSRLQLLLPVMKGWMSRAISCESDKGKKFWGNKVNKINYDIDKYKTWCIKLEQDMKKKTTKRKSGTSIARCIDPGMKPFFKALHVETLLKSGWASDNEDDDGVAEEEAEEEEEESLRGADSSGSGDKKKPKRKKKLAKKSKMTRGSDEGNSGDSGDSDGGNKGTKRKKEMANKSKNHGDSDDNYDPEEDESRMEIEEDSSDEAFEVGRSVSPKKKRKKRNAKRKKRLRSRNEYIDDGLEDEDGDDHFADLEDFVVD